MWLYIQLCVFMAVLIIMILRNLNDLKDDLAGFLSAFHINLSPTNALYQTLACGFRKGVPKPDRSSEITGGF